VNLGAFWDQPEDDVTRLSAGIDDDGFDVVRAEGGGHPLDVVRTGRDVSWN
jgi:glycerol dehydrogenase-like iron-containing ADH family enzyme